MATLKKKSKLMQSNGKMALLLLLPAFILFGMFTFYPFLKAIYLSFFVTDKLGNPGAFVGLANIKSVLTSGDFKNSLTVTLRYASVIGVGTFFVAMFLAYLSVNKYRGTKIYTTMFSLPMSLASAPIAAITLYIFGKYGMLNDILGTSNAWISDKATTFLVISIVVIWANSGMSFIYLLVGFRNVPEDLLESADLDGANAWVKFWNVYVPIASPQIFFVVFLNIISAFKSFAVIKILIGDTNKNLDVLVFQVYKQAFIRGRFETACIYAIALCVLIFLVTRIQLILEKKLVVYQ